jgi:glutathione synthase/RimK-type ligase-like ATP-grasp enzyme
VKRIAFVTSRPWPDLQPDDRPAADALRRRGCVVEATVWDDDAVDWPAFDAVVLRSCWDYHDAPARFQAWLDRIERARVRLWNPLDTVRWNLDKHYLAELAALGLHVTPTAFPPPGASLDHVLAERGWTDVVVKPRVSADGHRTHRMIADVTGPHADFVAAAADTAGPHADFVAAAADAVALVASGTALVQPYLAAIALDGELSFVFMAGAYSHAVRKRPAPGEFRVQPRLGAVEPADPAAAIIAQAHAVARAVPHHWLYMRVDGCVVDGVLLVMEVELIEPTLFFERSPAAAERFAEGILAMLGV